MTTDTPGAPWGASAADWQAFVALGLTQDLLPVVSDPHAKISEQSNMRDLGKTPSRFNRSGEAVGIPKWTQQKSSDTDVGRWLQDSRLGICVQTREVRAIDIDIEDPYASIEVGALIELGVGLLPYRYRKDSGKCLLAFRMPGEFTKRIIRTEHGIIEFLANGQQFIACGTHPKGARYEWIDKSTGVLGVPTEIPELTPAEFEVLWAALIERFALPDGASTVRNGMVPAIPRTADDLQDPLVAWLDENGWVTGYERDGKVNVRCPFEDGHSTDTGPSSTTYFPAGVGGFAMGHWRCLHASCAGRQDGDYLEAVGYVASDFEIVVAAKGEAPALPPFTRTRSGAIEPTLNNVLMAVRRPDICGKHLGFDKFKCALMQGDEAGRWEPFAQTTYTELRSRLTQGGAGFKEIGRELMRDAVHHVCHENAFDSALQWASGLRWDGVERVETFWSRYFGVEDTEYTRAVSRYTWTAFAGRCLTPGEKCDMVPVLIGLQGAGKTSVIEMLAPEQEMFAGVNLEKKDEDIARGLRGKLVVELAELRGLASREAEAIKDWISRRWEEWIPKYEEFSTRYGRRFLAVGTGNREGFLDDETGERRWLPMTVGRIDSAAARADRDQLWAEGIARYQERGVEWQDAFRLGHTEHHKYKVGDVWCELIEEWLTRDDMDGPRDASCIRLRDVLIGALSLVPARISRREELRAGKALLTLGFKKSVRRVGGVSAKVWLRGEQSAVGSEFA